jgi:hypothetical protein
MYNHNTGINKCNHWGYRVVIVLLFTLTLFSTYVAYRNSKPICNDLIRFNDSLTCVYDLGEVAEDKADVIIVK